MAVSSSLTPDFQTTLETWFFTLCTVVWLWSCLGQNFSAGGRRVALRVLVLGSVVIAVLFELDVHRFFTLPFWPNAGAGTYSQDFGPFTNRNHSSSLFALASVLAAGACYDSIRLKSRTWCLFLATIPLFFVCILSNTSRGGLLLFVLGLAFWLVTAAMKKGLMRKFIVCIAVVVALLSPVLVSKGLIGERLSNTPMGESILQDNRARFAEEVVTAFVSAPWLGRGIGVFEYVFPQVTPSSLPQARAIHPESDLLWMLFEGGLLYVIPTCLLIGWFFTSTGPWFSQRKKHHNESRAGRRMRKAFAISAFMALAHGIFDIPLHGLGYFLLFALIVSLAMRPRYSGSRISPSSKWFFRVVGLLIFSSGVYVILMDSDIVEARMASMAPVLHDRALKEAANGKHAEALVTITQAIELLPLDYRFYFLRAQINAILKQNRDLALLDFGRARAVEPRYALFCLEEGSFWMRFDPSLALISWREALNRYSGNSASEVAQYAGIVGQYYHFPEHHLSIWRLASDLPMRLTFLQMMVHSPHWPAILQEFLLDHPRLDNLNESQIHFLLNAWQGRAGAEGLIEFIKKSPRLQAIAWRILAQDLAKSGNFEAAFKVAAKNLPAAARSASIRSSDIPRLERVHLLNPVDILPGIELYYAQLDGGDKKSARLTLEKVMQLPNAPIFLKRELAALLADSGDFRGAWDLLAKIIADTPLESSAIDKMKELDSGIPRMLAPPPREENAEL